MQRTREAIALCRKIWDRDRSPFEGRIFKTGGVKLGFEPLRNRIPIWHGALLEKSIRLCGEMADGWIPNLLPIEGIPEGKKVLQQASRLAGRDPDAVQVVPGIQLLVGDDAKGLLQMMKFGLAVYYGPETSPYARAAVNLGYADDVAEVQAAYASGGSKAAIEATSDALANSVAFVGSAESCRARIKSLLDSGADIVNITMPGPTRAACEPVLKAIIP